MQGAWSCLQVDHGTSKAWTKLGIASNPFPTDRNAIDRDQILSDPQTGAARYILDTKYKTGDQVAIGDFHQMVSYAKATKCYEAVLVYPKPLSFPLDAKNDDIRFFRNGVRSLTFSLDGNLDRAGVAFLRDLLE
ncbi:MAG: hypothetical protein AB4352_23950 [Hormoscilla sp.]